MFFLLDLLETVPEWAWAVGVLVLVGVIFFWKFFEQFIMRL